MSGTTSLMLASEILEHYFAFDLLCRKKKHAPIWNFNRLKEEYMKHRLDGKGRHVTAVLDIPKIHIYQGPTCDSDRILDHLIGFPPLENPIVEILRLFPDNLFLCGGSIVDRLVRWDVLNDYDIFFCAKSTQEADGILRKCLEFMHETNNHLKYYFTQHCVTVEGYIMGVKIQFIRRIYETPDQILMGFDLWACRHGWNANMGYFTIPTGAISAIYRMFPIDVTQRSYTYGRRLHKYMRDKEFRCWIPGLPADYNRDIETPDGKIEVKCANGIYKIKYGRPHWNSGKEVKCKWRCQSTVYTYSNFDQAMAPRPRYDSPTSHNEMNIERANFSYIAFQTSNFEDIFQPSNLLSHVYNTTVPQYRTVKSKALEIMSDVENRWKTKNPGSQNFGRFNPIDEPRSLWYGFDTEYYIGISHEKFLLLKVLKQKYGFNKDVFQVIIEFVLGLSDLVE